MPASPAQIAASRANGLRSKGPVTPEGKAISRRNALKHGMAGEGVVLPQEDANEVRRRSARMQAEMRPQTEMGCYLVNRIARLTVRVERCEKTELAAIKYRALHAEAAFDEARIAEVDRAMAALGTEPAILSRKLRSMPEGIDRLIANLLEVREVLEKQGVAGWDRSLGERLAHLTGRGYEEVPLILVRTYSDRLLGHFRGFWHLGDDPAAMQSSAREQLIAIIDAEVRDLLAHRETLDREAIEEDRAGAAERSAFDPSKEAELARRYEAAADRGVFRALKELRRVEAEAAEIAESGPVEAPEEEASSEGPSGSFGAGPAAPVPSAFPSSRPASESPSAPIATPNRAVPGPPRAGFDGPKVG